jgi:small-conductance mechanosensitive channel
MTFDTLLLGNPLLAWALAIGTAAVAYLVLTLMRRFAVARARALGTNGSGRLHDVLADALPRTRGFFVAAVAVAIGSASLDLSEAWAGRLRAVLVIAIFAQVGLWASAAARRLLAHYRDQKLESDRSAATMVGALQFVVLLGLWSVIALLALSNLGVDITALVAGLGVGGIAIALAVQNVLGDLFASLAIVLDKPFIVGDFINVDDRVGTVEHIGLKTTRVRAISGEQLVFANADLLGARIRNFGRMYERRIAFSVGVTYGTPRGDLARIPELIQDAVEREAELRFDRCHLSGYGAYSIDFETVYFVTTPDYRTYMDANQRVLLHVHEAFERHGIEFAFPTQTLHLVRESRQPAGGTTR